MRLVPFTTVMLMVGGSFTMISCLFQSFLHILYEHPCLGSIGLLELNTI